MEHSSHNNRYMRHRVSHLPRPSHNSQHNKAKANRRHKAHHSLGTGMGTGMVHQLPVMVETGWVWMPKDSLHLPLHPYLRHLPSRFSCQLQTAGAYSVYWR